jgi:cardiolipin synthase
MMTIHLGTLSVVIILIFYVAGIFLAIHAAFQSRTPQGTMAWILALICLPFLSVPAFIFFGKRKIEDYDHVDEDLILMRNRLDLETSPYKATNESFILKKIDILSNVSTLRGNSLKLLLDGEETFKEMLYAIEGAKKYILLQMYIFRTDRIGMVFADALKDKALSGIKVYVLFERLGIRMSRRVLREMEKAGIELGEFTPIRLNKLQMNFRNHRKLLIVDGEMSFFGGINIGDDYLGRYPSIGFWRDSNVLVSGPIVNLAEIDFIKDWNFSQVKKMSLEVSCVYEKGDSNVLLVNSSPSEKKPHNLLLHLEIINSAKKRIWLANPYIVPPQGLIDALILSHLKGVEIRVLIPFKSDNQFVSLAMNVYVQKLVEAGIRVFRYGQGMMHQKVILVDSEIAVIGSSNFDFRSMHINFENTIITDDHEFIKNLDFALRNDFNLAREIACTEFERLPFSYKLASHLANSFAPIL